MAGLAKKRGDIFRRPFGIVSEPGQEHRLDIPENGDEEALAIGSQVEPGVIQAIGDLKGQAGNTGCGDTKTDFIVL